MRWQAAIAMGVLALGATEPSASIRSGEFSRSDFCSQCHRDIYNMWRASAHSRSLEDPVFLAAYKQTRSLEGASVAKICLSCHAPAVEPASDWELDRKLSWEGVSCDVCHSIASVESAGPRYRMVFDPGPLKRGPVREASSMAHEVGYSELHTQSLLCAPCHEFANSAGARIITTFSEWKQSPAFQAGQTCQACHMGRTKANVVDPVVKRIPEREVNLHEVLGGHSELQLRKALGLSVRPKREGDELRVEVRLTNKGAGHAVPTGMPGRRIVLEVSVRTDGGKELEDKRVYTKSFVDAAGKRVTRDACYFARGVKLETDSRLAAGEQRSESFRFPVPAKATAHLTVDLHYEHTPTGEAEDRTWITMFSDKRTLAPETGAN